MLIQAISIQIKGPFLNINTQNGVKLYYKLIQNIGSTMSLNVETLSSQLLGMYRNGGNKHQDEMDQQLAQFQHHVNSKVKMQHLYHMLYMRPFECALHDKKGGLAKGLQIVERFSQTQFNLKQVVPVINFDQFYNLSAVKSFRASISPQLNFHSYLEYIRLVNGDNMLCQMKTSKQQMQIAICVCMYNESREMLNSTLMGIGQNIVNLYKQRVDTDKIVVIIVQDGIQKMNDQVFQMFQILEKQSSTNFANPNLQQQKFAQYQDKFQEMRKNQENYNWEGEDNQIDLNPFLFSEGEKQQRQRLRFINIKKQYVAKTKLLAQINELSKRKIVSFEDLPPKAYELFRQQCQALLLKQSPTLQTDQKKLKIAIQKVQNDIRRSKPLVQNALTKTKQYCQQYVKSRQNLSHVSFFRTSLFFPEQSILKQQQMKKYYRYRNQNQEQQQGLQSSKNKHRTPKTEEILEIEQKMSVKMNIFFVVKYKNSQKLSSHNWFFNGFCKQFGNFEENTEGVSMKVSPKYSILLDVGLRPQKKAICLMYNTMKNNPKIGGVCGYMSLKIQRPDYQQEQQLRQNLDLITNITLNFVDIQRAQQIEYHFAHLIDKGFESIFKFIHVLPGAFSGYNMVAIWGTDKSQDNYIQQKKIGEDQQKISKTDTLLNNYFKSIAQKLKQKKFIQPQLSFIKVLFRIILPNFIVRQLCDEVPENSYQHMMYEENVYLAEDRILCMGIHKNSKSLLFLPDAYSFVDPVSNIPQLMGQRKRWINGSYFAFQKVSRQFSDLGFCQIIKIQLYYLALMNNLAFVTAGFFLFSISVAMQAIKADILARLLSGIINDDSPIYDAFVFTINFIYALLIIWLVYFSISLTNRDQRFVRYVYIVSTVFGFMSIILIVILVVDLARGLGRQSSYLISNQVPTFVDQIPGGQGTIDLIRYVVLGIFGLYAVPLLAYTVLFGNFRVLVEVLAGAISFTFYTPTYLIILNIYALCRMDDLSWGTKGLDTGSGKDATILNIWKSIKMIQVGKFLFWNIVTAGLLIHFGSDYLVRFFLTFAMMIIIAGTMLFKVICALVYYVYYKICVNTKAAKQSKDKIYNKNEPIACLYKWFKRYQNTYNEETALQRQMRNFIQNNVQKRFREWKQNGTDYEQQQFNPNTVNFQTISAVIIRKKKVNGKRSQIKQAFQQFAQKFKGDKKGSDIQKSQINKSKEEQNDASNHRLNSQQENRSSSNFVPHCNLIKDCFI